MALSISSLKRDVSGNKRTHSGLITFDSSYPTGGESLTPANIGLHVIERITIDGASGFSFEYDYTNQKVLVKCPGVVTGAAGAVVTDDFPLQGTGATATSIQLGAGNGTTRFGGQVELANAVDLSSVSARFIAVGY